MQEKLRENMVIVTVLTFLFMTTVFGQINKSVTESPNTEKRIEFDTLTFTSASIDAEFNIGTTQTVYDEAGNEFIRTTFKRGGKTLFTCDIPAIYKDTLDKQNLYTGHIDIVYANEYYDYVKNRLRDTQGSDYKEESILELLKQYPDGYRISGVHFMYAEFIKDGIFNGNQDAENDLIKTFVSSRSEQKPQA